MRTSTAINPAAYSGGTFIVHPPNYSAYYMRAMMHQQAKQQALSQYYDKLQNNINPAGVRSQDLDGWNQKADAWQRFGIEHRDALVNPRLDGGKAMNQFQSMHRDLLGDIAKSKHASTQEMALQKVYSDPRKAALATRNDMNISHSISASIYDPQHYKDDGVTPHDATEMSFNAPPYDINKQKAVASIITRGMKPDRTYGKATQRDYAAGTEVLPFTEKHSDSNLKTMSERAGNVYDSDLSVQRAYDNKVLQPDEFDSLNKAYKKIYPNDDIGNDPRKHFMAEVIMDNSQVRNDQELHNVPRIPQARQMTQAQLQQQYALGWVNQMASAMQKGDTDEVNRLGAAFSNTGNQKVSYVGIFPGKIGSLIPGVDQKSGFMLKHIDKVYDPVTQTMKDKLNQDEFDPNDPSLIPKLAGAYQRMTGASPALKTGVMSQIINPNTAPGAQPKQTIQMPHGALDNLQ